MTSLQKWTRCLAVASLVLALGCSPSWPQIMEAGRETVDEHRQELTTRLSQLSAVADAAAAQPRKAQPSGDWGSGPRPDFSSRSPGAESTRNAALLTLEQLQGKVRTPRAQFEMDATKEVTLADGADLDDARTMLTATDLALADILVAGDSLDKARRRVEERIARVTKLRYVLVLRTYLLAYGEVKRIDPAGFEAGTAEAFGEFDGGRFLGDALLFDVRNGTVLGGFPVQATNSDEVKVRGSSFLRDDLVGNIERAIRAQLDSARW